MTQPKSRVARDRAARTVRMRVREATRDDIDELGHPIVAPMGVFKGRIYGDGWELTLSGYIDYGSPNAVRFQGRGKVGGEEWIYDCVGYLSPAWPNGTKQRPALAGSIVRTAPHSNGAGGVAPAGVVCSWYAVLDKPAH
ncbi:hypothetical protein CO709_01370 [Burkholderia thailandensis]|nr:hypothetical protein CO709_01370 [Burkholderia thailandensis]